VKAFLANLDSAGGHVCVCFALLAVGAIFFKAGVPKGEDLIVASLAIMGRSMLGQNGKGAGIPPIIEGNPQP